MTDIEPVAVDAFQSGTPYGKINTTSSATTGLPAGANPPHVVFPPAATFSMETPLVELDASQPVLVQPDPDLPGTLDQVARENLLAIGAVAARVPVAETPTNPTTTRRPLSELVAAEPVRREAFQPALEVDRYRWPAVCEQLADKRPQILEPVLDSVRNAVRGGHTLIGFLGAEPQVGCTTMLLSVARCLAESGSRVAVVDADFATAALAAPEGSALDLASQLGLVVTVGWEDVLAGRVPLAEGVIGSIAESIAVLPLSRRPNSADELLQVIQTHGIQASVSTGVLRAHYDMVLVDLGCAAEPVQVSVARAIVQHCRLDTTLIVAHESAAQGPDRLAKRVLAPTSETACLGVVENWAEAA